MESWWAVDGISLALCQKFTGSELMMEEVGPEVNAFTVHPDI